MPPAGEIAARTWEKESAGTSLDAASALMTRRLYQNWGVTAVREVARTKLEGRGRWITDVGGNPCASAYALVCAGRCARDRNLAYALNARGRVGSSRAWVDSRVRGLNFTLPLFPFVACFARCSCRLPTLEKYVGFS